MAAYTDRSFEKRVSRIDRQHSRLSRGYLMSVGHDGLVVARPRPASFRFPIRGIALMLFGFLAFKTFVLAFVGTADYSERVAALKGGTIAEQAAGFVMSADPLTVWGAEQVRPYLPARK